MAAITPEKLNALMLKARKGATASFTLAQIAALLEAIGGSLKPVVGLVAHQDAGKWNTLYPRLQGIESQWKTLLQKYVVPSLPPKPKAGALYVMDLQEGVTDRFGPSTDEIQFHSWVAAGGVEIQTPDGKSTTLFPDKYEIPEIRRILEHGEEKRSVRGDIVSRWLTKNTDWIARINKYLGSEEHVPAAERTRDGTGTCPVCYQNIKLSPASTMVLHGYKRPGHGTVHGSCFGVGYPAFEVSPKGIIAYLEKGIEPSLKVTQARLVALEAGSIQQIMIGSRNNVVTPEDPRWPNLLADTIRDTKTRIRQIEMDHAAYSRLKLHWVERDLPKQGDRERNWFADGQKASVGAVRVALAVRVAAKMVESISQLIRDAMDAGFNISEKNGSTIISKRHRGNGSILQGIQIYPDGSAIDLTVTQLDTAKSIRRIRDMRAVLGLREVK
jgi:hypothetical protein